MICDVSSIDFSGLIRGVDENSHRLFSVKFEDGRIIYGEYDSVFTDGYSFYIDILSFGYEHRFDVGLTGGQYRENIDVLSQDKLKEKIVDLFCGDDFAGVRAGISPFSSKRAVFTGVINFRDNWI